MTRTQQRGEHLMTVQKTPGGFGFIPGDMSFASAGVVALAGMAIERAVLAAPAPLAAGFEIVRRHMDWIQRPLHALCGFELRLPASMPMAEFETFNGVYRAQLEAWGLQLDDGSFPLARTNVAPTGNAPDEPAVLAFAYTVAAPQSAPTFVVSGVAELPERFQYPRDIVRRGETSQDALAEKARHVVDVVNARLRSLRVRWDDTTLVHLYTPHDVAFALQRTLRSAIGISPIHGVTWHDASPPVSELELEVDVRRYHRELTLPPEPTPEGPKP